MADPTHADALRLLELNEDSFTSAKFNGWLTDVKERLGSSETDRLTILYGLCWLVARAADWQYVQRIGDKSFSAPNPEQFKKMYLERCNERRIEPVLLGRAKIRKINSDVDDDEDLNP
jgi:hypothetical protein